MYVCVDIPWLVEFWHPIYTALFCRENEVNERSSCDFFQLCFLSIC